MGAADPIFKTPTKAPAAPVASPAPLAPYDPDPYYGTNTKTPAATPAPVATPAPAVAPVAPQQPQFNPFMQTYGQNRTPQQQMFNRFPQRFQQPQPVAQPAQGPVYADQSLNAPGNQPQQPQYGNQPQYGRFGRGFMPQNRFGYDRQIDQLRGQGQYGQQGSQVVFNNLMSGQQQMPAYNGPTQDQFDQMKSQPATGYESAPSLGGQAPAGGKGGSPVASAQLNPFQAALVKGGTPYVQGAPGAPYAIGQGIPGGAPGGYMPLMNSNGTPVSSLASANPSGGKGGNPTSNGSTGQYQ